MVAKRNAGVGKSIISKIHVFPSDQKVLILAGMCSFMKEGERFGFEECFSGLELHLFGIHPWLPLNHDVHIKEVLDFDVNHRKDRGHQICVLRKKSFQIYLLEEDRLKSVKVSRSNLVGYTIIDTY